MKGKLNTDLGQVLISPEVVAKYAYKTDRPSDGDRAFAGYTWQNV